MDEEIKRWTARRKSALVLELLQGRTTVSEAARQYDLPPSEIEGWVDQAKAGKVPPIAVWAGNLLMLLWGWWLMRRVVRQ